MRLRRPRSRTVRAFVMPSRISRPRHRVFLGRRFDQRPHRRIHLSHLQHRRQCRAQRRFSGHRHPSNRVLKRRWIRTLRVPRWRPLAIVRQATIWYRTPRFPSPPEARFRVSSPTFHSPHAHRGIQLSRRHAARRSLLRCKASPRHRSR